MPLRSWGPTSSETSMVNFFQNPSVGPALKPAGCPSQACRRKWILYNCASSYLEKAKWFSCLRFGRSDLKWTHGPACVSQVLTVTRHSRAVTAAVTRRSRLRVVASMQDAAALVHWHHYTTNRTLNYTSIHHDDWLHVVLTTWLGSQRLSWCMCQWARAYGVEIQFSPSASKISIPSANRGTIMTHYGIFNILYLWLLGWPWLLLVWHYYCQCHYRFSKVWLFKLLHIVTNSRETLLFHLWHILLPLLLFDLIMTLIAIMTLLLPLLVCLFDKIMALALMTFGVYYWHYF